MTSRVRIDLSKPVFIPALPTPGRIAEIRAEYLRNQGAAETYGCLMDAKYVRDLLAILDATHIEQSDEDAYLIQYVDPNIGPHALWWRPNCKGYTANLDEAGIYTKEAAENQQKSREKDRAIPLSIARAVAYSIVPTSRL